MFKNLHKNLRCITSSLRIVLQINGFRGKKELDLQVVVANYGDVIYQTTAKLGDTLIAI